jgi:sterol desaturase/sphingolipid hydroxylase (fatty acid hydroxylase superfamily)
MGRGRRAPGCGGVETVMDARELFEPSLQVFLSKFGEFCVRYFLIGGGLYCLLHLLYRERVIRYRVQARFPSLRQVGHEIGWSMSNTACSALSTLLIYRLVRDGHAPMYLDVAEYGWLHLGLSAVLCLLGYDAWLYWEHRLLHTDWLYAHVHAVHHRSGNPTVFASFAHHPVETFMGNVYFILFVLFVPVHPLALGAAGLYMFYTAIVGHLGYEFYPRGFPRRRLLGLLQTSTYHNIHHREMHCNFGAWFIFWDRLMGTDHPGYEDAFEAVGARAGLAHARPAGAQADA